MYLLYIDDPVFWDRVMLSQGCPSSSPISIEGVTGGEGMDSPGVHAEPLKEHPLTDGSEIVPAKRFKSDNKFSVNCH
jgi:hypothetical protein